MFTRRREVRWVRDLLRMVLTWAACDWTLRQVTIWCTVMEIGSLSKVAVRKRMLRCADWLGYLITTLLVPVTSSLTGLRIRLLDTRRACMRACVMNPPAPLKSAIVQGMQLNSDHKEAQCLKR